MFKNNTNIQNTEYIRYTCCCYWHVYYIIPSIFVRRKWRASETYHTWGTYSAGSTTTTVCRTSCGGWTWRATTAIRWAALARAAPTAPYRWARPAKRTCCRPRGPRRNGTRAEVAGRPSARPRSRMTWSTWNGICPWRKPSGRKSCETCNKRSSRTRTSSRWKTYRRSSSRQSSTPGAWASACPAKRKVPITTYLYIYAPHLSRATCQQSTCLVNAARWSYLRVLID